MRAGDLRALMLIESVTRTSDGAGGSALSWSVAASAYAKVSTLGGREFQAARQTMPSLTHEITIRYRTDITPAMRVAVGNAVLSIHGIADPDGRKREMVLYCTQLVGEVVTFKASANLVPGDIGLDVDGNQVFPGSSTLAPETNIEVAGSQVFAGTQTVAPGDPVLAATGDNGIFLVYNAGDVGVTLTRSTTATSTTETSEPFVAYDPGDAITATRASTATYTAEV